ncbi:MAG: beta-ketoacyl synthase chain length factor [Myxococcales bacterium]|nr:beta-ketoacyl synthase chain length factor [Myxococcales bacterium]
MSDTPKLELHVAGVGLWLPGVPDVAAWQGGARGNASRDEPFPKATGASIERRARRRASALCRALADAYSTAATQARIDVSTTSSVFGSALGEVTTMLGLLDEMSRHEPLSPMSFATSVHSAAAGTMSISAANRGFTTAISAFHDTAGAAFFEAIGLLHALRQPVIIACGDENSPDRFVGEEHAFDMLAAVVALVPPDHDGPRLARLRGPHLGAADVPAADLPPRLGRNPQAGLLDLVAAILAGQTGTVALDRGRGTGWCVTVSEA